MHTTEEFNKAVKELQENGKKMMRIFKETESVLRKLNQKVQKDLKTITIAPKYFHSEKDTIGNLMGLNSKICTHGVCNLSLSTRARNALETGSLEFKKVEDILQVSPSDLFRNRNLGKKVLEEIREEISRHFGNEHGVKNDNDRKNKKST